MNAHDAHEMMHLLANLQLASFRYLQNLFIRVYESWCLHDENERRLTLLQSLQNIIDVLANASHTYEAIELTEISNQFEDILKVKFGNDRKGIINSAEKDALYIEELLYSLMNAAKNWRSGNVQMAELEVQKNTCSGRLVYMLVNDKILKHELESSLSSEACTLRIIKDVEELKSTLEKQMPAAVICDFKGQGDGDAKNHEMASYLNKIQNSTALIYLSHFDSMAMRTDAANLGAYRYFTWPFNMRQISQSLNRVFLSEQHKPCRVLIIDDGNESMNFCADAKRRFNLEVRRLSDPLKTIEMISSYKPEVVVIDLQLQSWSGAVLADIVRQDENWADIRIIYLAEKDLVDERLQAQNYAGEDYIAKPIDPYKLGLLATNRAKRARYSARLNNDLKAALLENDYMIATMNKHDIVSITDVAGRITFANEKFTEISGYKREELIGKNHRILKSNMHPRSFYEGMWNKISNGEVWQGAICNQSKNGRTYWVDSTIVPFLDGKGKPYKYVSARTDITYLRENEIRYKSSKIFANVGTWDWHIQSGVIYWSDRMGFLFGYKEEIAETNFEKFMESIHPDDRHYVSESINDCIYEGKKYAVEHRIFWPDGSVRWVHASGDVIRNEDGDPLHMLGVIQDVTNRKTAEQTLIERDILLNEAQSLAGIGNWRLDLTSETLIWSDHLFRILGYKPGSVIPSLSFLFSVVVDDDVQKVKDAFEQTKQQGTSDVVYRIVRPDGELRYVHEVGKAERDHSGNAVSLKGTIQDITSTVETEQALIQAREEAEAANRAKSKFLSNMSHELRTPLNAIIGFGQLMKMESYGNLTHSQVENLDEITKAGAHLLELINEVLDLSKIEAGFVDLRLESISVGDIVYEALNLIKPLAQKRNIEIKCKSEGGFLSDEELDSKGIRIFADRTRARQALLNLLSNAVKYNKVNGSVVVDFDREGEDFVRISVTDSGRGISSSQQERLFTAFNRITERNEEIEGTGIGLVITKKIVELMHGKIGLNSEVDKGSTFWILLPENCIEGIENRC